MDEFTSTNGRTPSSSTSLSDTSIIYRFRGGVNFRAALANIFGSAVPSVNTVSPGRFLVNNSILNTG